jgi:hypothetical protein
MVQEGKLMEFQHIIHNLFGGIILVHFGMMVVVCLFYFDQRLRRWISWEMVKEGKTNNSNNLKGTYMRNGGGLG